MARKGKGVNDPVERGKQVASIIPTHFDIMARETLLAESRVLQNSAKTCEFERTTDKTIIMKKMADFIATGMAAYEEDLKIRRLKLCRIIQIEEAELKRDTIEWLRRAAMSRTKENRITPEIISTENEENRPTAVISPQHQYSNICSEIRSRSSREIACGVKRANLEQMLEKDMRTQEEKRSDRMWHEIMCREVKGQVWLDETERRKRLEKSIHQAGDDGR